jgi:hypothetical protein
MNSDLRKNIQSFLLEYQDSDIDNWATTDLLLECAANLLRQCVVEDYSIPKENE